MKTVKVLILYSVIYYVAYRCKIAGFSVLSSILFLSLAFFLFLTERKREQTALPLTGLFALGILGGEGIAVLQLSTLSSNWTREMWQSLFFSYFFFYFVYHFFRFFLMRKDTVVKVQKKEEKENIVVLKRFISALLVISLLSFLVEASVLRYIPLFTTHTPHAYSAFHLKGLHYFTTVFVLVPSLIAYLTKMEKKIHVFSLVSFSLSLLLPILLLSRFQLIFSIVLFVFTLLLEGYRIEKKKLCFLFLFLIVSYVLLTIERAHSVSYLLGIFSMKDKNMPIFFVQPYMYVANNFENLNLLTKKIIKHSYGFRMAYPFFTLSGLKFFLKVPLSYHLYLTKKELSTLTLLYDAYYDFGLIGVSVFSAILGGIAALLQTFSKKENPFILLIHAQFAFYLLFSFFTTWFSNASSIFYFGVCLFFAILWDWRTRRKRA